MCYLRLLAAIPGFFISSLLVYVLMPVLGNRLDIIALQSINFVDAMLMTLIIWVAVAPIAAAGTSWIRRTGKNCGREHRFF